MICWGMMRISNTLKFFELKSNPGGIFWPLFFGSDLLSLSLDLLSLSFSCCDCCFDDSESSFRGGCSCSGEDWVRHHSFSTSCGCSFSFADDFEPAAALSARRRLIFFDESESFLAPPSFRAFTSDDPENWRLVTRKLLVLLNLLLDCKNDSNAVPGLLLEHVLLLKLRARRALAEVGADVEVLNKSPEAFIVLALKLEHERLVML